MQVSCEPTSQKDADKLGEALNKLAAEDPSFRYSRDEDRESRSLEKWWRMGRAVDIVRWCSWYLFVLYSDMIYTSLLVDVESVDWPFFFLCRGLQTFSRYQYPILQIQTYLNDPPFLLHRPKASPYRSPTRRWLRAWASCIWRSSSIAWSASLRWRQRWESLKWPIARRSLSPLSCGILTRSRLEVLDSMSLASIYECTPASRQWIDIIDSGAVQSQRVFESFLVQKIVSTFVLPEMYRCNIPPRPSYAWSIHPILVLALSLRTPWLVDQFPRSTFQLWWRELKATCHR